MVFTLSYRQRRREIDTLFKIGGSRVSVITVMASEIVAVLTTSVIPAGALTLLTSQFEPVVRASIRM